MILSIESSCDDSSIAITQIDNNKLIAHKKITQETHSKYGGVVPEVAAREHANDLPILLTSFKKYFKDLKAVSVTCMPGLSVTLLEGIIMAKAISISLNIPLIGVNHLYGHIYSLFIDKKTILPQITLLLSGGHTSLFVVNSFDNIQLKANSLDDSVGESFDKVAKMLSLGYPGGPHIEEKAKKGNEDKYKFPIALSKNKDLAFSYSGLKNAVRLQIEKSKQNNTLDEDIYDICASFQKTALSHLLLKVELFFKQCNIENFSIVGGVSCNSYIRDGFLNLCQKYDKKLFLAKSKFCCDNAGMIGRYAIELYNNKIFSTHNDLSAKSRFL